jgi:quercetin dioxygenase-like cupin family protein
MNKTGYGRQTIVEHEDFHVGGSVMEIEAGKKTDTIFHRLHGKLVYILAGVVTVSVIQDGQIKSIRVRPGQSFYIKPGLAHSFESTQQAILIEFSQKEIYKDDLFTLFKGTAPEVKSEENIKDGEFAKMAEEDIIKVTEEPEVEELKKATRKKRKTSKKPTAAEKKTTTRKRRTSKKDLN